MRARIRVASQTALNLTFWFRGTNPSTLARKRPGLAVLGAGEVSRGEKMLYSGTDPESYITEYSLVYEDKQTETELAYIHPRFV